MHIALRLIAWIFAPISTSLAAGCSPADRDPQVLAVLNGYELTKRDLAAESWNAGDTTRIVVDRVIDRKLLASAARRGGAETDPDFLAAVRKSRDELLVATLIRRLEREIAVPPRQVLEDFASRRPWAFADREIITLSPIDPKAQTDQTRVIDTAQLDKPYWEALRGTSSSINIDGRLYRVVARQSKPLKAGEENPAILSLWRQAKIAEAVADLLERERLNTSLEYLTKLE